MNKHILLFLVIGLLHFPIFAQTHSLSGQVVRDNGKPVEFATIILHPISDSTDVQGTITRASGKFKIEGLKANTYQMTVQVLGFEDWMQELVLATDSTLEDIQLQATTTDLEAVEVIAERSHLESRLGKKVLRIGADLSTTGSNALEALEIIPSITTTPKGEVQIRGNSNVVVYINGKETKRTTKTLQYISAEALEKIEVITNPSAKYDAEGVGGILNLVYRKDKIAKVKLEGIANLSLPRNVSGGINASLNRDKFSFHSNLSLEKIWFRDFFDAQRTENNSSNSDYENSTVYDGTGFSGSANVGVSFEPDTTLSMGLEVNYDRWDFKSKAEQRNLFRESSNSPSQTFDFSNDSGELEDEIWVNYSLEKSFKNDQNLQFSLTAGGEDEVNFTKFNDFELPMTPSPIQQFLQKSDETESQRYYQGKLDFEAPFFGFGTYETGFKADFIRYHIFQQIDLRSDNLIVPDNDFRMDMQKLAVYFLQNHQIGKLEYSLGIRMEQFSSDAFQQSNETTFKLDYLRFFPSFQLNYLLPDHSHTFGFQYTRRINRPGFFKLNPYWNYEDPLNLQTGNPALRPEIADLYECNYHKELDKLSLDFTLYRRETKDAIQSAIQAINETQTLETPINFAEQINQGIEGQLEYSLNKIFKTSATFTLGQTDFRDAENVVTFDKTTSWGLRLKQQIKLPNNWKIDLSGNYRAPRFEPQSKQLAVHYVNLFIAKKFKNKRGSLSFGVRDIFNTRQETLLLQTEDFEVKRRYKWQTRRISLGLRYFIVQ